MGMICYRDQDLIIGFNVSPGNLICVFGRGDYFSRYGIFGMGNCSYIDCILR